MRHRQPCANGNSSIFLGNGDFYSCKIDTQSVAGEFLLGMLTVIMALIHTAF